MKLQDKIFYCRKRAGLSQETLAEKVGVSRQAVSKWESGEATPEVNKLLALARAFHVSTDWLLSDEEPEETPAQRTPEQPEATEEKTRMEEKSADFLEALPGFLGRMIRKYGWLYGVYNAIGGFVLALFGMLTKTLGRQFEDTAGSVSFGPLGGGTIYYDANGNNIDPSALPREVQEALGISTSAVHGTTPFDTIGNFEIVLGLLIVLAGVCLAVYLRRRSKNSFNK